jgi:hypothetical protein
MTVGILGAVGFFLILPPLLALAIGLVAQNRIRRNPEALGGLGFAQAGVSLGCCSLCLAALAWVLMPTSTGHHRLTHRSYCAANLRGIMQSMIVYSAENSDAFPVMTFAPYSPSLNAPSATAVPGTPDNVLDRY